jgi:hypothetical protein
VDCEGDQGDEDIRVCVRHFRYDSERNMKETDQQWRMRGGQLAKGKNNEAKERAKI